MTEAGTSKACAEEAAAWHARLGGSITAAELAEFKTWRADPEHAAAYQTIEALWRGAGALAADPEIDRLTQETLQRTRRSKTVAAWPLIRGGAIAAVGVGVLIGAAVMWTGRPPVYETGVGEQRTVRLADGSVMALDTATRVRVRYDGERRSLDLLGGQALFTVAHDGARPFVVRSGDARVTAVGTVFEVRREAEGARVTLVSGAVDVRDAATPDARRWRLAAGEQLDTTGRAPVARSVDLAAETSWTQGRLTFAETPLVEAVAEVNRYLERPIVLEGAGTGAVKVNGAFNTGDREAFAAAAVDLFGLEQVRGDDGALVLRDRPSSK